MLIIDCIHDRSWLRHQNAHPGVNYHVIARKGNALTWQSPGTIFVFAPRIDELYQEIATSHRIKV